MSITQESCLDRNYEWNHEYMSVPHCRHITAMDQRHLNHEQQAMLNVLIKSFEQRQLPSFFNTPRRFGKTTLACAFVEEIAQRFNKRIGVVLKGGRACLPTGFVWKSWKTWQCELEQRGCPVANLDGWFLDDFTFYNSVFERGCNGASVRDRMNVAVPRKSKWYESRRQRRARDRRDTLSLCRYSLTTKGAQIAFDLLRDMNLMRDMWIGGLATAIDDSDI